MSEEELRKEAVRRHQTGESAEGIAWRNGVVEHPNDVWDRSLFRTERFGGLRKENAAFVAFHNEHHRYSAHGGASPDEV